MVNPHVIAAHDLNRINRLFRDRAVRRPVQRDEREFLSSNPAHVFLTRSYSRSYLLVYAEFIRLTRTSWATPAFRDVCHFSFDASDSIRLYKILRDTHFGGYRLGCPAASQEKKNFFAVGGGFLIGLTSFAHVCTALHGVFFIGKPNESDLRCISWNRAVLQQEIGAP